jgi:hypothetical protein
VRARRAERAKRGRGRFNVVTGPGSLFGPLPRPRGEIFSLLFFLEASKFSSTFLKVQVY